MEQLGMMVYEEMMPRNDDDWDQCFELPSMLCHWQECIWLG